MQNFLKIFTKQSQKLHLKTELFLINIKPNIESESDLQSLDESEKKILTQNCNILVKKKKDGGTH